MESALLIIFAGIFKACADKLIFHYEKSVFSEFENPQYWNPAISWKNKYKSNLKTPRFFLSTTTLVFLTDGWHLFNMLWSSCFILAAILYQPVYSWVVDFILLKGAYGLFFELFWKHVLDRGFYDQ